ncbi:hypothetical protein GCM10010199_36130 [Dactylosporangium roseum]
MALRQAGDGAEAEKQRGRRYHHKKRTQSHYILLGECQGLLRVDLAVVVPDKPGIQGVSRHHNCKIGKVGRVDVGG